MVPHPVKKKVLKQKGGELAKLVLPGGGDLASRIWAAIGLHVKSVAKWLATGATNTPAFKDAVATLENFYDVEEGGAQHSCVHPHLENHTWIGKVKYSMCDFVESKPVGDSSMLSVVQSNFVCACVEK